MRPTTQTDPEILQWLGQRLASARRQQGLSRQDAAARAGVSRRTLYRAEHGQNPTLETLIRLLRLYGRLDALEALLPEPELSPLALIRPTKRRRSRPDAADGAT